VRLTRFWSDQVAAIHEFFDYADEHFGWAETAKTERERAIFFANGGSLAGSCSTMGSQRRWSKRSHCAGVIGRISKL
jgi:hypothetical protein